MYKNRMLFVFQLIILTSIWHTTITNGLRMELSIDNNKTKAECNGTEMFRGDNKNNCKNITKNGIDNFGMLNSSIYSKIINKKAIEFVSKRIERELESVNNNEEEFSEDIENVILTKDLQKSVITFEGTDDINFCLMDNLKDNLIWWTFPNGTLKINPSKYGKSSYMDLSHKNMSTDLDLVFKIKMGSQFGVQNVKIFSAAYNELNSAPFRTLSLIKGSLKFLTLRGNNFKVLSTNKKEAGVGWATFPILFELLELDISNCSIQYLTKDVFKNLTNLRRLFISNNKMLNIPHDTFYYVQKIQYLDLSFTNVLNYDYQMSMPTLEVALNTVYGLKIQAFAFRMLPVLRYLDLSHSKITRNSAMAFTHLGDKLKYLSLCYTAFPMISNALFRNTAIEGLDLSGNPFLSYNIVDDAFEGIADSLKYLYFENSNIKNISWLQPLNQLRVLSLAGNNINAVTTECFSPLINLELLDLSSNHVSNWYNRVFTENVKLRMLGLRNNNINIITTEMLKDFQLLDYLSLGGNNFLCDCFLLELVEVAVGNNKNIGCAQEILQVSQSVLQSETVFGVNNLNSSTSNPITLESYSDNINQSYEYSPEIDTDEIEVAVLTRYIQMLKRSSDNIKGLVGDRLKKSFRMHFISRGYRASLCSKSMPFQINGNINESILKFELMDYKEEYYWCFNETEKLQVGELNCQTRTIEQEITAQLQSATSVVLIVLGTLMGITILGTVIYLKRWHIHYYYSSLKSASLLSIAAKETASTCSKLSITEPNMMYDIFISYCQSDRQWVLDELLPNVEETEDISICLHERDFKIGITILDNIISSMDRSRSLMLIISSNFLLSHWCQFEMYLAQHRIFETSREHLMLVFLEDIPRSKRPKTLQYLMDVKTYIKWPTNKDGQKPKLEERTLFWKRLKRSLEYLGISSGESRA